MTQERLQFAEVDPATPEAAALMAALDSDLSARYPGFEIQGIDAATFREAGGVFLVGRVDTIAVACGALRPMEDGAAEVKRMYVSDADRRRGYGRTMLRALEEIAASRAIGSYGSKPAGANPKPSRYTRARATILSPATVLTPPTRIRAVLRRICHKLSASGVIHL